MTSHPPPTKKDLLASIALLVLDISRANRDIATATAHIENACRRIQETNNTLHELQQEVKSLSSSAKR